MKKKYEVNENAELINDRDIVRMITGAVSLGVLCGAIFLGKCERNTNYTQPREQVVEHSSEYSLPQNNR